MIIKFNEFPFNSIPFDFNATAIPFRGLLWYHAFPTPYCIIPASLAYQVMTHQPSITNQSSRHQSADHDSALLSLAFLAAKTYALAFLYQKKIRRKIKPTTKRRKNNRKHNREHNRPQQTTTIATTEGRGRQQATKMGGGVRFMHSKRTPWPTIAMRQIAIWQDQQQRESRWHSLYKTN